MDLVWGSRGTKGELGWSQRGILIDFIGQITSPSTLHLIVLDSLLALLQFLTLIISFSITLPSDLDASTSSTTTPTPAITVESDGDTIRVTSTTVTVARDVDDSAAATEGGDRSEAARDYFGLLGLHETDERENETMGDCELTSQEEEEEEGSQDEEEGRRKPRNHYQSVQTYDDDLDEIAFDDERAEEGDLMIGSSRTKPTHFDDKFSASSSSATKTTTISGRQRQERMMIPFEPIAKLRFRHIWNEVKPGSFKHSFETREEDGLRDQEEGRSGDSTRMTRRRRGSGRRGEGGGTTRRRRERGES